jgi:hypothetical protein
VNVEAVNDKICRLVGGLGKGRRLRDGGYNGRCGGFSFLVTPMAPLASIIIILIVIVG